MNAPPSPPPSQPWKSMEPHQTISLRNPHQCPQKRYLSKFNRTWLSFFKDSWNTIPFSIFLKNVFIIYYYLFFSGKCLLRGRGSKWIVWFMHMWKKLYIIQIFQNLDNVDNVYDYFPARSWKIQVQNVMFMTLANSSIKPHTILKNVTNSWSGLLLSTLPLQGFTWWCLLQCNFSKCAFLIYKVKILSFWSCSLLWHRYTLNDILQVYLWEFVDMPS